jgi:hypothetical protein
MGRYLSSIGALLILSVPISYVNANIPYMDRYKKDYFQRIKQGDFRKIEQPASKPNNSDEDVEGGDLSDEIEKAMKLKELKKARSIQNSPNLKDKVSK